MNEGMEDVIAEKLSKLKTKYLVLLTLAYACDEDGYASPLRLSDIYNFVARYKNVSIKTVHAKLRDLGKNYCVRRLRYNPRWAGRYEPKTDKYWGMYIITEEGLKKLKYLWSKGKIPDEVMPPIAKGVKIKIRVGSEYVYI